ncbi:unnamed protein product, partial [Urochloa humidicola]
HLHRACPPVRRRPKSTAQKAAVVRELAAGEVALAPGPRSSPQGRSRSRQDPGPRSSKMSSSSDDVDVSQRQGNVEVLMPNNVEGGGVTGSSAADTASSAAPDGKALAEKAIDLLPPEFAEMARDPKRHANSVDPGW